MALGWFDAIAGAALPVATGLQTGALEAEELRRKRAEEALRNQLLQSQIDYYGRGRDEYHPATKDEAIEYELGIHPERTAQPDRDTQTEWERAGFPNTPEGRAEYLKYTGEKARAEYPERFRPPVERATDRTAESQQAEGDAILSSMQGRHDAVAAPFAHAYAQVLAQHPDWAKTPGRAATEAMQGIQSSRPDLFRAAGGGYQSEYEKLLAAAAAGGGVADSTDAGEPEPVPATSPTVATSATPPPGDKRVITQDQADYLRATHRWDPALYEVR